MTDASTNAKPFFARIGLVRLVLFFFLLMLVYFGPQALVHSYVLKFLNPVWRGPVSVVAAIGIGAFELWIYRLLVLWLERRKASEAITKPRDFLVGVGLAIAMFSLLYALYIALGTAQYHGINPAPQLMGITAMVILSGLGEELVFRGGVYRVLEDMFGSGLALILSGALFGGLHLMNPHATLFSAFAIAVEAGILLGAAYALTRNLWLPIGIHMGWNFSEGGIFNAAVSGGMNGHGILNIPLSGPDWLSGGSFGPEASVVTLVLCTTAGLFFVWRAIKSGHWVPLRARMMLD